MATDIVDGDGDFPATSEKKVQVFLFAEMVDAKLQLKLDVTSLV